MCQIDKSKQDGKKVSVITIELPEDVCIEAIELSQSADSCSNRDETQRLRIEFHDAGGGQYIILKTEKWAIDEYDKVMKLAEDVVKHNDAYFEREFAKDE